MPHPATVHGLKSTKIISAASTNATLVEAGHHQVFGWHFYNNTASVKCVKLFNKATAPTPGTDVPVELIVLPPNGGHDLWSDVPLGRYNLGLGYCIVTEVADSGTTAVAVNDVAGNLHYV